MLRAIKAAIWCLALAPLVWLLLLGFDNRLGPDPGKALVDGLGLWALRFLLITLALRPLRDLSGRREFIQIRRLLGLFAFFYATLHLGSGVLYVIGFSIADLLLALRERTYIVLGFAAWLLMVPLALTSNRWSQRWLGRRWVLLHRFIYPLAILACLHFIWLVRSDYGQAFFYGALLALLLLWRLLILRRAWRAWLSFRRFRSEN